MDRASDVKEPTARYLFASLVLLLALILAGCMARSTPPGADIAGGKVGRGGFTFLRWRQGLAIMIWHDLDSASTRGSGSTGDPVYRLSGDALSLDGRHVEWEVQTRNGRNARFWIDDVSHDLENGALFIVTTRNGTTAVQQLSHDLSGIRPDYDSCVAFARGIPDLDRFVDGLSDPQAEAQLVSLVDRAKKHLQAQLEIRREDISVTHIRPLLPLCSDLSVCPSSGRGYVIVLVAEERAYEYRARILDEMCILWREVSSV